MPFTYFIGVLKITNLLIAMFILLHAYMFLVKTLKRRDRKPWDYLFFSSLIYVMYQIASVASFFVAPPVINNDVVLRTLVEFLFSGLVLLAFVSQHDLILKSPLILIARKVKDKEEELVSDS